MHHVRMIQLLMIIAAVAANATGSHAAAATLDQAVTLADEGEARVVIYAPADVMRAKDVKWQGRSWYDIRPEAQKVRLCESVKDLARCLSAIAGTKIDVVSTAPKADDTRLPILIGELARAKYGDVRQTDTSGQGGRYVVTTDGIGLYGESDLAASYMIYEMLHRLGARWYIPSEMGEVLPSHATMTVPLADGFIVPSTLVRQRYDVFRMALLRRLA